MFKRDGLLTRLLAVVLAIAMAWASTPIQGLAEAMSGTDVQDQGAVSATTTGDDSSSEQGDTSDQPQASAGESGSVTDSKATSSADSDSSSSDAEDQSTPSASEDDSKDSGSSTSAVATSAVAAPTQDSSNDTTTKTTFTAHWTNAVDKEVSYTNADYDPNNSDTWTDFSCTPSDNSLHKSTLKVYLKLAGDSKTTYKAGSVKIYVPAGFYRGLDKDDPLLVACEDSAGKGKPLDQVAWMIPKAPDTNDVTDFNYVEETREVNGQQVKYYVMQNTKELSGATELDVDIDYRFRPTMLDVLSEKQADGSDMGVYQGSYPVSCTVNDNEVASKGLDVSVRTKVNPSKLTLSHASQDPNKGVFFTWDSAWGEKPKDADKYFYIVWYANYRRGGASTMPYTYKLSVDSSKTDGGELIGVKKYTPSTLANEQYEQPGVILQNMDSSYSGIAGGTDLLQENWVGISNSPTTNDVYNANAIDNRSIGASSNWQNQVYALLFRYPLTKVIDAISNGVDMANDGIDITNGLTLTETWQDGNVVTINYGPSGDTSVKSLPAGGGSRGLTKVRESEGSRTYVVKATQSFLSQGHDMVLPDFTLRSYNFDDKAAWDTKTNTYKASTGFDIKDGDYYLYSATPDYFGKKPGVDNISSNNPLKLDESEYSLKSFYLDDDEYDVTYTEGLGWQRAARASDDYSTYVPISIYVRKRGEKGLTKYGELVRNANGYAFKSVDGTNDVNGVSGNNRVQLPDDVVQIEMKESESNHYASYVRLHYNVALHPDKRMEARLNSDIDSKHSSVVGGFASGEQTVEGKSLGKSGEDLGSYWHLVSYELSPIASDVQFGFEPGKRSDDEQNNERRIPVTIDLYNETNVYKWSSLDAFANVKYMRNYIPQRGTFYVLLPAGTYIKPDEVTVGVRWDLVITRREVQLLPNWQNTGRTMLEVSVDIPEEQLRYPHYWSGIFLRYTLHDSYTNIVDRGGLVTSSAIFVNSTGQGNIFNSNAKDSSYTGKGFEDWNYFKDIVQDAWSKGYQAATTQAVMDFGSVTALQAGFSSRVSTDINPVYQASGVAYLGDRYIDRLQYTSSSSTRTDDLILYDLFSPEDKNAVGSFESIDVSSIDAKPTYDPDNPKTTDTCKPVVYYATQVPTDKTRSLDSGIWSTTPPKDPSTVRAVAIDCRKTDAGNDFVLDKKGTLVAYVGLIATGDKTYAGRTEKNEAVISARTFVGTAPASSDTTTSMTAERTVKLLAADLSIEKTCDPASGTKERPAEIGNDANKQLTYTIKVTNNAKASDSLPDVTRIHVKDALPLGLELDTSKDITVSSASLGIKDGTKIGSQSVVSYQSGDGGVSFDIGKLHSEGSVSITVPVVRKDPVKETTTYVNTATIETVGNAEDGHSSSTYHKTSVTSMPLAGAGGFAGLAAVGCAVMAVSAVAWVRRRRRE